MSDRAVLDLPIPDFLAVLDLYHDGAEMEVAYREVTGRRLPSLGYLTAPIADRLSVPYATNIHFGQRVIDPRGRRVDRESPRPTVA